MPQMMDAVLGATTDGLLHHAIVPLITPVLACASEEDFILDAARRPTEDEIRLAIGSVLGKGSVDGVRMVRKEEFLRTTPRNAQGYGATLPAELDGRFGADLLRKLGAKRFRRLRAHFGLDRPTGPSARFCVAPHRLMMESVIGVLYHCFGGVFAHDRDAIAGIAPLAALLPRAVPVGVVNGRAKDWITIIG